MENVDNPFDAPAILSLCPGFLGLERGLERAVGPVRVVAHVEIEAFVIENLVAAMEKGVLAPTLIWTDVKTFKGEWVCNRIHGIIGGYPCQPFSNAGQRGGTSDPRHLYPFISGIIKTAGPIWCWFENVDGHLSLGYPEVSADLRSMGYAVEAGIYSAEEVGAPHERDRLFILAIKAEYVAHLQKFGIGGLSECKPGQILDQQGYSGHIVGGGEESTPPEYGAMADTTIVGVEGCRAGGQQEPHAHVGSELFMRGSSGTRWPAGRGEQQYAWEPPRIESRLGCVFNGYNFREDLLRAYGNSVVEQTAEVAFVDLLKKHGITIEARNKNGANAEEQQ